MQTSQGEARHPTGGAPEEAMNFNFKNALIGQQPGQDAGLPGDQVNRVKSQPSLARSRATSISNKWSVKPAEYLSRRKRRGQPLEISY